MTGSAALGDNAVNSILDGAFHDGIPHRHCDLTSISRVRDVGHGGGVFLFFSKEAHGCLLGALTTVRHFERVYEPNASVLDRGLTTESQLTASSVPGNPGVLRPMAFIALAALSSGSGQSQSFEVASVHANKDARGRGNIELAPGGERFFATNVPLGALIQMAYNVSNPQCNCQTSALPVLSERFDIQAKAEHPVRTALMLQMLQNLLRDRFNLAVRRESKELQAYVMVVDKGGPKLHPSSAPHTSEAPPINPYHARGIEGHSFYALDLVIADATMADLAWRLSSLAVLDDHVVVDKTGLNGHYDLELKFSGVSPIETPSGNDAPSIFTALREQLGLRLDLRKIPVEFITVEHAEQPTEN